MRAEREHTERSGLRAQGPNGAGTGQRSSLCPGTPTKPVDAGPGENWGPGRVPNGLSRTITCRAPSRMFMRRAIARVFTKIVHIAVQQGEIAAHNIAYPESKKAMDYRLLSRGYFYRTAGGSGRAHRKTGASAQHQLCGRQISVQRSWQIAHYGSEGRL